ncbi:hypothetical protein M3Y98_00011200 [Aphelenchoides besseyi]|nr:hypothetical protein M3Y98_00011200 [Aphelenchoides besseyi]
MAIRTRIVFGLFVFEMMIVIGNSAAIQPIISTTTPQTCADGRSFPLLEGEDQVFPCCNIECPEGFTCEFSGASKTGICCPNLDLLYELYEEQTKPTEPSVSSDIPNVPNVPVWSNQAKDIRRAPVKAITDASILQASTIATLSATRSVVTTQNAITTSQPPLRRSLPPNIDCRRQPLQRDCQWRDGETQKAQLVIRWYVLNGQCQSYIFGYCPGLSISNDRTLRTQDDCEALCLSSAEFRESDLFNFLTQNRVPQRLNGVKGTNFVNARQQMDNPAPFGAELVALRSRDPLDFEFNSAIDSSTAAPRKNCQRSNFRTICKNGFPSQFTIRWFRHQNKCVAYPWGYCHGELVHLDESIKSQKECEAHCPGVTEHSEAVDLTRLIR